MDRDDLLELIHLQILKVQDHAGAQLARGEGIQRTMGLLRSLRLTLRTVSAGIDPDEEAASSFVLTVDRKGRVFLRRDMHMACLMGSFLRSLFQLAGIRPEPGQVLIVEPDFARRAIEESLGESLAEESRLEQERADLRAALAGSAGSGRDRLLRALGQLDEREADLLVTKVELIELKAAAEK